MFLTLLSLALAAESECSLKGATAVNVEHGRITVSTPAGTHKYKPRELEAAAISCGYPETVDIVDTWSNKVAWGNTACVVSLFMLWPIGIAAPILWYQAVELRDEVEETLLKEANR